MLAAIAGETAKQILIQNHLFSGLRTVFCSVKAYITCAGIVVSSLSASFNVINLQSSSYTLSTKNCDSKSVFKDASLSV